MALDRGGPRRPKPYLKKKKRSKPSKPTTFTPAVQAIAPPPPKYRPHPTSIIDRNLQPMTDAYKKRHGKAPTAQQAFSMLTAVNAAHTGEEWDQIVSPWLSTHADPYTRLIENISKGYFTKQKAYPSAEKMRAFIKAYEETPTTAKYGPDLTNLVAPPFLRRDTRDNSLPKILADRTNPNDPKQKDWRNGRHWGWTTDDLVDALGLPEGTKLTEEQKKAAAQKADATRELANRPWHVLRDGKGEKEWTDFTLREKFEIKKARGFYDGTSFKEYIRDRQLNAAKEQAAGGYQPTIDWKTSGRKGPNSWGPNSLLNGDRYLKLRNKIQGAPYSQLTEKQKNEMEAYGKALEAYMPGFLAKYKNGHVIWDKRFEQTAVRYIFESIAPFLVTDKTLQIPSKQKIQGLAERGIELSMPAGVFMDYDTAQKILEMVTYGQITTKDDIQGFLDSQWNRGMAGDQRTVEDQVSSFKFDCFSRTWGLGLPMYQKLDAYAQIFGENDLPLAIRPVYQQMHDKYGGLAQIANENPTNPFNAIFTQILTGSQVVDDFQPKALAPGLDPVVGYTPEKAAVRAQQEEIEEHKKNRAKWEAGTTLIGRGAPRREYNGEVITQEMAGLPTNLMGPWVTARLADFEAAINVVPTAIQRALVVALLVNDAVSTEGSPTEKRFWTEFAGHTHRFDENGRQYEVALKDLGDIWAEAKREVPDDMLVNPVQVPVAKAIFSDYGVDPEKHKVLVGFMSVAEQIGEAVVGDWVLSVAKGASVSASAKVAQAALSKNLQQSVREANIVLRGHYIPEKGESILDTAHKEINAAVKKAKEAAKAGDKVAERYYMRVAEDIRKARSLYVKSGATAADRDATLLGKILKPVETKIEKKLKVLELQQEAANKLRMAKRKGTHELQGTLPDELDIEGKVVVSESPRVKPQTLPPVPDNIVAAEEALNLLKRPRWWDSHAEGLARGIQEGHQLQHILNVHVDMYDVAKRRQIKNILQSIGESTDKDDILLSLNRINYYFKQKIDAGAYMLTKAKMFRMADDFNGGYDAATIVLPDTSIIVDGAKDVSRYIESFGRMTKMFMKDDAAAMARIQHYLKRAWDLDGLTEAEINLKRRRLWDEFFTEVEDNLRGTPLDAAKRKELWKWAKRSGMPKEYEAKFMEGLKSELDGIKMFGFIKNRIKKPDYKAQFKSGESVKKFFDELHPDSPLLIPNEMTESGGQLARNIDLPFNIQDMVAWKRDKQWWHLRMYAPVGNMVGLPMNWGPTYMGIVNATKIMAIGKMGFAITALMVDEIPRIPFEILEGNMSRKVTDWYKGASVLKKAGKLNDTGIDGIYDMVRQSGGFLPISPEDMDYATWLNNYTELLRKSGLTEHYLQVRKAALKNNPNMTDEELRELLKTSIIERIKSPTTEGARLRQYLEQLGMPSRYKYLPPEEMDKVNRLWAETTAEVQNKIADLAERRQVLISERQRIMHQASHRELPTVGSLKRDYDTFPTKDPFKGYRGRKGTVTNDLYKKYEDHPSPTNFRNLKNAILRRLQNDADKLDKELDETMGRYAALQQERSMQELAQAMPTERAVETAKVVKAAPAPAPTGISTKTLEALRADDRVANWHTQLEKMCKELGVDPDEIYLKANPQLSKAQIANREKAFQSGAAKSRLRASKNKTELRNMARHLLDLDKAKTTVRSDVKVVTPTGFKVAKAIRVKAEPQFAKEVKAARSAILKYEKNPTEDTFEAAKSASEASLAAQEAYFRQAYAVMQKAPDKFTPAQLNRLQKHIEGLSATRINLESEVFKVTKKRTAPSGTAVERGTEEYVERATPVVRPDDGSVVAKSAKGPAKQTDYIVIDATQDEIAQLVSKPSMFQKFSYKWLQLKLTDDGTLASLRKMHYTEMKKLHEKDRITFSAWRQQKVAENHQEFIRAWNTSADQLRDAKNMERLDWWPKPGRALDEIDKEIDEARLALLMADDAHTTATRHIEHVSRVKSTGYVPPKPKGFDASLDEPVAIYKGHNKRVTPEFVTQWVQERNGPISVKPGTDIPSLPHTAWSIEEEVRDLTPAEARKVLRQWYDEDPDIMDIMRDDFKASEWAAKHGTQEDLVRLHEIDVELNGLRVTEEYSGPVTRLVPSVTPEGAAWPKPMTGETAVQTGSSIEGGINSELKAGRQALREHMKKRPRYEISNQADAWIDDMLNRWDLYNADDRLWDSLNTGKALRQKDIPAIREAVKAKYNRDLPMVMGGRGVGRQSHGYVPVLTPWSEGGFDATFMGPLTSKFKNIPGLRNVPGYSKTMGWLTSTGPYTLLEQMSQSTRKLCYVGNFAKEYDALIADGWSVKEATDVAARRAQTYIDTVMYAPGATALENDLKGVVLFLPAYRQAAKYWISQFMKHPLVMMKLREIGGSQALQAWLGPYAMFLPTPFWMSGGFAESMLPGLTMPLIMPFRFANTMTGFRKDEDDNWQYTGETRLDWLAEKIPVLSFAAKGVAPVGTIDDLLWGLGGESSFFGSTGKTGSPIWAVLYGAAISLRADPEKRKKLAVNILTAHIANGTKPNLTAAQREVEGSPQWYDFFKNLLGLSPVELAQHPEGILAAVTRTFGPAKVGYTPQDFKSKDNWDFRISGGEDNSIWKEFWGDQEVQTMASAQWEYMNAYGDAAKQKAILAKYPKYAQVVAFRKMTNRQKEKWLVKNQWAIPYVTGKYDTDPANVVLSNADIEQGFNDGMLYRKDDEEFLGDVQAKIEDLNWSEAAKAIKADYEADYKISKQNMRQIAKQEATTPSELKQYLEQADYYSNYAYPSKVNMEANEWFPTAEMPAFYVDWLNEHHKGWQGNWKLRMKYDPQFVTNRYWYKVGLVDDVGNFGPMYGVRPRYSEATNKPGVKVSGIETFYGQGDIWDKNYNEHLGKMVRVSRVLKELMPKKYKTLFDIKNNTAWPDIKELIEKREAQLDYQYRKFATNPQYYMANAGLQLQRLGVDLEDPAKTTHLYKLAQRAYYKFTVDTAKMNTWDDEYIKRRAQYIDTIDKIYADPAMKVFKDGVAGRLMYTYLVQPDEGNIDNYYVANGIKQLDEKNPHYHNIVDAMRLPKDIEDPDNYVAATAWTMILHTAVKYRAILRKKYNDSMKSNGVSMDAKAAAPYVQRLTGIVEAWKKKNRHFALQWEKIGGDKLYGSFLDYSN